MSTEITVPQLGESVSEATVARWLKSVGDTVARDEPLVELETDKVTLEVNAPAAGVLGEIVAEEGATVEVGALLGHVGAQGEAPAGKTESKPQPKEEARKEEATERPAAGTEASEAGGDSEDTAPAKKAAQPLSPAVRKLVEENDLDPSRITGSGKDGRLTKGDVLAHLEKADKEEPSQYVAETPAQRSRDAGIAAPAAPAPSSDSALTPSAEDAPPREERVRMSRLRQRIAERLKQAQDNAAMLTTFNEVDMTAVMALRNRYKDAFERRHGVRLGFMSFFVKACIEALKEIPAVNAEIDGTDVIYKNHYDIGVAVGTPQGLVVPVVRDADRLGFGTIEKTIGELGKKARDGKLTIEELTGGTFTISNGGVYGSLMSTPILNPPQSGILGMHKIQPRPMAIGDAVEIRPMMYLALSYDHRIIDGREAVTFLVRVKDAIEDPQRLLIEV